tara:strand:+ start:11409 stop:11975 length:567 start_codon:yes stop_codon:yes gene_type:complete
MSEKVSSRKQKIVRIEKNKLDIYHIISLLPIMPYQELADVQCGEGDLSVPLGKSVYRGKVTALDTVKKNLTSTRRQVKLARLGNVKSIHIPKESEIPLKDESVDGAMSAFLKQSTGNPKHILNEINRSLRKGGWLGIIEWHKDTGNYGPPAKDRIEPDKLRRMAEQSGFRFYIRHDLSDMAYMLVFWK